MTNIEEKIAALLRLADSPNENEAKLALEKAQKLMAKYHIDNVKEKSEYITETIKLSASYGGLKWVQSLLYNISNANAVFMLRSDNIAYLYGTHNDVKIVRHFFDYAYNVAIYNGKVLFKKSGTNRYTFWNSYGLGFSYGVKTVIQTVNNDEGVTAIVHNKLDTVINSYEGTYSNGRNRKSNVSYNVYAQGIEKGKQIHQAINTKQVTRHLLG